MGLVAKSTLLAWVWLSSLPSAADAFVPHRIASNSRFTLSSLPSVLERTPELWNGLSSSEQNASLDQTVSSYESQIDALNAHINEFFTETPSMLDLQEELQKLQTGIEEKQDSVRQVIENLHKEAEESRESMAKWEEYYVTKIKELEAQAQIAEEQIKAKERAHNQEFADIRNQLTQEVQAARDKINALEQALQSTKNDAHKQQIAANELAQRQQDELKSRIETLEALLSKQTAAKAEEAAKAREIWDKRMSIEAELASSKKDLEATIQELQQRLRSEQEAHLQLTSKLEASIKEQQEGAQKRLDQLAEQARSTEEALRASIRSKEEQHAISISTIRAAFDNKERALSESVKTLGEELQVVKLDSHRKLMEERELSRQKEEQLRALIDQKTSELEKQKQDAPSQSAKVSEMWQHRMDLEKDLSAMKKLHEESVLSWQNRYRSLEEEKSNEINKLERMVQQMEADYARQKSEHADELARLKSSFDLAQISSNAKFAQDIRSFEESQAKKVQELHDALQSARMEVQNSKFDAHKQLLQEREQYSRREIELNSLLEDKQRELENQKALVLDVQSKGKEHLNRQLELEREISELKSHHESVVASLEMKISASENQQQRERLEWDAKSRSIQEEAEKKLELAMKNVELTKTTLNEQSQMHEETVKKLRESFELQKQELHNQLSKLNETLKEERIVSQQRIAEEQRKFENERANFRLTMSSKEAELVEMQSQLNTSQSRMQEQAKRINELEAMITSLKREHDDVVAGFDRRVHGLEDQLTREKKAADSLLQSRDNDIQGQRTIIEELKTKYNTLLESQTVGEHKSKAVFAELQSKANGEVSSAMQQLNAQRAKFDEELKKRDENNVKALQEIERSSREEVQQLKKELETLKVNYDLLTKASEESLAMERRESQAKQDSLLKQIRDKEREIRDRDALIATEKIKVDSAVLSRSNMENEVARLNKQHADTIMEWKARYESLQEFLKKEEVTTTEKLARNEAEDRKMIEAIQAQKDAQKRAFEERISAQETSHREQLELLRESYTKKEVELNEKLTSVRNELQNLKQDLNVERSARGANAGADSKKKIEEAVEEGLRRAERVRYELTKELVKMEVDLLRQKAELRQRDAQIALLLNGRGADQPEPRLRENLSRVKERVAQILRGPSGNGYK